MGLGRGNPPPPPAKTSCWLLLCTLFAPPPIHPGLQFHHFNYFLGVYQGAKSFQGSKPVESVCVSGVSPVPPNAKHFHVAAFLGTLGLGFIQTNWGNLLGWVGSRTIVHIFIFVRRCDLHFTLLLHLFRQVKANELLMNKSVKYSPPSQPPILMLLISRAFCAAFSCREPNVGLEESSLGRQKHLEPGHWRRGQDQESWGHQNFQSGAQNAFHLNQPVLPGNCVLVGSHIWVSTAPRALTRLPSPASPTMKTGCLREDAGFLQPWNVLLPIKIKSPLFCSKGGAVPPAHTHTQILDHHHHTDPLRAVPVFLSQGLPVSGSTPPHPTQSGCFLAAPASLAGNC